MCRRLPSPERAQWRDSGFVFGQSPAKGGRSTLHRRTGRLLADGRSRPRSFASPITFGGAPGPRQAARLEDRDAVRRRLQPPHAPLMFPLILTKVDSKIRESASLPRGGGIRKARSHVNCRGADRTPCRATGVWPFRQGAAHPHHAPSCPGHVTPPLSTPSYGRDWNEMSHSQTQHEPVHFEGFLCAGANIDLPIEQA